MISDLETEVSDAGSDAPVENPLRSPSDLLEVTFQKNPNQTFKYREAEPKILGVTEIALTVFFISSRTATFSEDYESNRVIMPFSSISIIAGGLAIAAEKLHPAMLKACLGMQIVMCVIYGFILTTVTHQIPHMSFNSTCWPYYDNESPVDGPFRGICNGIIEGYTHLELIYQLIMAVQIALSATLAVYCCKVIQCCSPSSHVPVIAMKSPTAPE
ncbi:hypothetical protein E1301_Tti005151 [Triplophysa tibetana]|uniref:Membrane-spanning 4-domains subfamily A member 4A n=1 Tax=Triplophysa tibetana TaxID=1572043 RepID=A0A5A9PMH5_9TELE|nr:hypothetical protein E1301_Tti005151 [Triplophysa tibetana]